MDMFDPDYPRSAALRFFTALPPKGRKFADLTDRDKLALCVAAGAPVETTIDGCVMTMRTTVPCGVADRGDGGYIVGIGPEGPDQERIDLLPLSFIDGLPGARGLR